MADHDGRNDNDEDKKWRRLDEQNSDDDGDVDEDQRMPQTSLAFLFGGEVLLSEALPYLHAADIVEKEIVCRQWKEECDLAIIGKGRHVKKGFGDKAELRDAVNRYCEGNRDEIENIAEEYGYPIGKWDVSRVEDFSEVFYHLGSFNEDIGAWDVGNATNMHRMFLCATSFNQNLSGWDVSKVTNMNGMFGAAVNFNGDISPWDTSRVTDMSSMFCTARAFNRDLSNWDTSRVSNMHCMFYGAAAFDGDISSWNVFRVTDRSYMFAREGEVIEID